VVNVSSQFCIVFSGGGDGCVSVYFFGNQKTQKYVKMEYKTEKKNILTLENVEYNKSFCQLSNTLKLR